MRATVMYAAGDVSGLKRGDVVVAPFMWADNTCDFCSQGLHTSCRQGVNGVSTAWTAGRARPCGCRRRGARW
jgi:D-arabinose 1-dehydrogenase-like Zn-dependent alcohol dehydrogenase